MKKFNITVNGNTYQVEVEEIKDGTAASAPRPAVPAAAPVPASAPAPKAAPAPAASAPAADAPAGAQTITAPMPGTVLDVKVKEGESVKQGQVLVILEAMKMENEIFAPSDGTVASVNVSAGTSVNAGDVLVSLK